MSCCCGWDTSTISGTTGRTARISASETTDFEAAQLVKEQLTEVEQLVMEQQTQEWDNS
jgi:hypothetical protein